MKKFIYLFLFFTLVFFSKAQNTDSLKLALKSAKHDTVRCEILMQLIENENDDLIWPKYNRQLQVICQSNLKKLTASSIEYPIYTKFLASSFSNQGYLAGEVGDMDSSLKYNQLSIDVLESLLKITKSKYLIDQIKIDIATSLNNIAINYTQLGDTKKTIEYFEKSLKIQEELNDKVGVARSLSNLAFIYDKQGDIPKALEYNHKSLKIKEAIGDKDGIANSFNNIGTIYGMQNEFDKALSYFNKAYKIQKEINNNNGIPQTLSNFGYIYLEKGNPKLALKYYYESLALAESINDLSGVSDVLSNIGSIYHIQAKKADSKKQADSLYDLALINYERALSIQNEIENKSGIATTLINITEIYYDLGNVKLAKGKGESALKITKEIGQPYLTKHISGTLSKIYNNLGNYKLAYEMLVLHKVMSDSISNEITKKASLQKSFQYEYDKKVAADSIRVSEERKVTVAQLKQEKTQRFALYGGLALVIVFSIFVFNRFRISQKQKSIIEQQKNIVDEKNLELNQQYDEIDQQKQLIEEHQKEMVDSITYAKRIQDAILPPTDLIKQKLPQSFVLYKPKDIVAGDFYWMEQIDDTILIAAADCTGHGVPGAMVSVVCSNALNRAVKEFHLSDTGAILDKVTDLVIETFEKSVAEVKDGMDISLLSINKVTKEIKWSGANNPLWYFEGTELKELTADKQPIGKSDHRKAFTSHNIELKDGTTFYLFTDGYADQFGGPKGKKYKYKQFQETIISSINKEPIEQELALSKSFESWKGDLEQVDDVCIIGIKI